MAFLTRFWWNALRLSAVLWAVVACDRPTSLRPAGTPTASKATPGRDGVMALIHQGDSLYRLGSGYEPFAQSLVYYDSALATAERLSDSVAIAEALYAKGRLYDAWNRDPNKTIQYYAAAAALFNRLPEVRRPRAIGTRFLVAHAYGKTGDTLHTLRVLRGLLVDLSGQPDTLLQLLPFTVEMALTASRVGQYQLADSILDRLTQRSWIVNDPRSIRYLDHYLLTRARIDAFGNHRHTTYLDSVRLILNQAHNAFERQFYGLELAAMLAAVKDSGAAYAYQRRAQAVSDTLAFGPTEELRAELSKSEQQQQARQKAYELTRQRNRNQLIALLTGGLIVISLLSFYLFRQYRHSRAQAHKLAASNLALDEKVTQIDLLNKEIQHRVKNNLHMIYSLLQMQQGRSSNPEVVESLKAARLRVESVAALHNLLTASPTGGADFPRYLKVMIDSVISCHDHEEQVLTDFAIDEIVLPDSAYLALALVLNEWVTNSVKYALPPAGQALRITVSAFATTEGVQVRYGDNGLLSPGITYEPGLGTRIVQLLTRQLGATLSAEPDSPFAYRLHIPNHD